MKGIALGKMSQYLKYCNFSRKKVDVVLGLIEHDQNDITLITPCKMKMINAVSGSRYKAYNDFEFYANSLNILGKHVYKLYDIENILKSPYNGKDVKWIKRSVKLWVINPIAPSEDILLVAKEYINQKQKFHDEKMYTKNSRKDEIIFDETVRESFLNAKSILHQKCPDKTYRDYVLSYCSYLAN